MYFVITELCDVSSFGSRVRAGPRGCTGPCPADFPIHVAYLLHESIEADSIGLLHSLVRPGPLCIFTILVIAYFDASRVIIYVTTLCMIAFFRLVGFSFNTFDGASGVSGISLGLLILYAVRNLRI